MVPRPKESDAPHRRRPDPRAVAYWLLACGAMVVVMTILGGLTRLTHSGLSMVEWKPLSILPPLTEVDWQDAFLKYRRSPEYQQVNVGMTLEGFKGIFWLEYIHRLWGRIIGIVFLGPFIYFVRRGAIARELAPKLAGIFLLGGLQGLMGWLMVKSGLVDRPDVSQYRLGAHLALAVLIYGLLVWVALGLLAHRTTPSAGAPRALSRRLLGLLALAGTTLVSGAFVAGLDAGLYFSTFPLMNGRLVPDTIFAQRPLIMNFFENVATVQFTHRVLALSTLTTTIANWWVGRDELRSPRARLAFHLLPAAALLQVTLGVTTLLWIVPISLAAAHQAGALLLVTALLWALHEVQVAAPVRPLVPSEQELSGPLGSPQGSLSRP